MPELAEVELARRIWAKAQGQQVQGIEVNGKARIFRELPANALKVLEGKTLTASLRHGKRMYFSFGDDLQLEVHLGMSGKVYRVTGAYEHRKHDHVILRMSEDTLILNDYRMFGKVMLHEEKVWTDLPPDPLSRKFNQKHVNALVERWPNKILKAALLTQELFPGVGNWMADEICWRMKVNPAQKLSGISPVNLFVETKEVCRGSIKYVADANEEEAGAPLNTGFSAGGYAAEVPPKSWLFQHRWKKGGMCPRCKIELERDTVATRTTAWCDTCQNLKNTDN